MHQQNQQTTSNNPWQQRPRKQASKVPAQMAKPATQHQANLSTRLKGKQARRTNKENRPAR